jgi:hypothetical protein
MREIRLLFLLICFSASLNEVYFEELLLRPLPDGRLLAHFQFTTHRDFEEGDPCEYMLIEIK